jgi:putative oxygen-independent coproporphyrinogen III oxidase
VGSDDCAPVSLYVHIPFCSSRCGYCDFNTYTATELVGGVNQEIFHEFLIQEIAMAAETMGRPDVATVFFGGGTPTLIGASALNRTLEAIGNNFTFTSDIEVTTEANPDSVDLNMLKELRSGGFNRISIGMQSASQKVLKVLQRTHTPGSSEQVARLAQDAGFDHVNLDLIYGTPGETDADVRASVNAVLAAGVDHVSAYSLIVEDGTALARQVRSGELPAPDDDLCADRYAIIDSILTDAGMQWYEVSNWSVPEAECRHNQAYWSGADWWGIGPGAHSHRRGTRWWNYKHPSRYAGLLQEGKSPAEGHEVLSPEEQHTEAVMLGLRTRAGMPQSALTPLEWRRASELEARNLVDPAGLAVGVARLTDSGRLLADAVVREVLG